MNLVFTDKLYFTKDFTQFSNIPLDGYYQWSQVLATDFPGCTLDIKNGRLLNNSSPRLNFETL
ncbi:MAG: hypothetical protein ACMG6E_10340 [Candidatus Roizmanbacteria bacterium]